MAKYLLRNNVIVKIDKIKAKSYTEFKAKIMKKLLILSAALLAAISCNNDSSDPEVVITTLEGTEFSLSQFEVHTFPATDVWVIEDQSATVADFAGLSAAIEYISSSDASRQIEVEFANLTTIPAYAIYGVSIANSMRDFTALYSVSAPYVSEVGAYAFDFCDGLTSIDMEGVESVGNYAFRGCKSLKSLNLPLATTVEYSAFNSCEALESIYLPLLESVDNQAFTYCKSLTSASFPEALSIASGAFSYCYSLTSVEAPKAVSIGERAFSECMLLESVEAPLVEEIGAYAFISCSTLESYTISSLVSSIGSGVFNNCTNLTEIIDESDNFIFEDGILYNADQSEAIVALQAVVTGAVVLPESVTEIHERAFYNCVDIVSVELPSVLSISNAAFAHCTSLLSATVSAATTLEDSAFYNCVEMTTFSAPYLTTIGDKSFYNCENLLDLSIATASGVVIESIDTHAFHSAYLEDTVLTVGAANADLVSYGDTLTVDLFEVEFSEIIVLEA